MTPDVHSEVCSVIFIPVCCMLQQIFYSPKQRKMTCLGFFRISVWRNILRASRKGYQGNRKGEGFILGGLYVIGPENQVLFQLLCYNSIYYAFVF